MQQRMLLVTMERGKIFKVSKFNQCRKKQDRLGFYNRQLSNENMHAIMET